MANGQDLSHTRKGGTAAVAVVAVVDKWAARFCPLIHNRSVLKVQNALSIHQFNLQKQICTISWHPAEVTWKHRVSVVEFIHLYRQLVKEKQNEVHSIELIDADDGFPYMFLYKIAPTRQDLKDIFDETYPIYENIFVTLNNRLDELDEKLTTVAIGKITVYDYDVALSFAGEDRPYVEKVAKILKSKGVRVFYDDYERVDLWGKDLYAHLDDVYRKKSKYCVVFISRYYARKVWTKHERSSAQSRALFENREYILPARFDQTEIPGIRDTIAYVDLRELTPSDLALLIIDKLES